MWSASIRFAVRTYSEKDHTVPSESETVVTGLLFLEFFDGGIQEFDLLAAQFTDKVIMMSVAVPCFVSCYAITKMHLPGKACLGKQFHCTVNCGLTCPGTAAPYTIVQLLCRHVTVALEKVLQDQRTLGCHLQLLSREVFTQDLVRCYGRSP